MAQRVDLCAFCFDELRDRVVAGLRGVERAHGPFAEIETGVGYEAKTRADGSFDGVSVVSRCEVCECFAERCVCGGCDSEIVFIGCGCVCVEFVVVDGGEER